MSGLHSHRSTRSAIVAAGAALAAAAAATALAAPASARAQTPPSPPPSGTPSPVGPPEAAQPPPEAAGSPPASLPAGLLALEQKMEGLHLSSVKVSFHETVTLAPLFAHHGRKHTLPGSHGVVEVGDSGRVARIRYGGAGGQILGRLLDGRIYVRFPGLGRTDGGRPWVRAIPSKHRPEHLDLGPKLLDAGSTFALLRKDLAGAVSVSEDGAATVGGRQAIHFTATFTGRGRGAIGGPQPRHIPETGTLQLFIEPSGLPIETIGTVANGLTVTSTVTKLQSVNIPVVVKVPPARLTIGERALDRIERRRARRERRRVRECVKRASRQGKLGKKHGSRPRGVLQRCLRAGHSNRKASGTSSTKVVVIKG